MITDDKKEYSKQSIAIPESSFIVKEGNKYFYCVGILGYRIPIKQETFENLRSALNIYYEEEYKNDRQSSNS